MGQQASAAHVVVGGGVLGLSVASSLARRLAKGSARPDVLLVERSKLGSGASGIAGGIVRCYYRSPAITEIVRLSVERFERSPQAFGFRQVGFLAAVPERQVEDLQMIAARQAEVDFRMGTTGTGVTVGGLPEHLGPDAALDPYGPPNPQHTAGDAFRELAAAALARVLRRFRGTGKRWQATLHGGVVGLTPDGYPVLDHVLENAYVILDAGHAYKMLALGPLAASDILDGPEPRLAPFRLTRFEADQVQPSSTGPFPWT